MQNQLHSNKAHIAAIVLACVVIYIQTLAFDFAYDDALRIIHNPLVTNEELSLASFSDLFSKPTPPGNLYRPLSLLSYRLNFLFSELDATSYHFINLLLYIICCILIYTLLKHFFQNNKFALFVGLLFAVHPIHVEAVANIIGRAEILVTVFGLSAALLFSKGLGEERKAKSILYFSLSALLFFCASLSKESAFTLLLLIPLYGFITTREQLHINKLKDPLFVIGSSSLVIAALLSLILRKYALGSSFILSSDQLTIYAENPIFHLDFFSRLVHAFRILGDYIILLILPLNLSADYSMMPWDFFKETFSSAGALSICLLGLFTIAVYLLRKKTFSFFGLWFLASFALSANIITPIGTIMGDRLAFLPSIGFLVFIVCLLNLYLDQKSLKAIKHPLFLFVVLLVLTLLSLFRVPVWKNNETLFRQSIIDAPQSPKSMYNYAVHLFQDKNDLRAAKYYLNKALNMHPTHLFTLKLLADIALKEQNYAALEHWYRKILAIKEDDQEVLSRLNKLEASRKQPDNLKQK